MEICNDDVTSLDEFHEISSVVNSVVMIDEPDR